MIRKNNSSNPRFRPTRRAVMRFGGAAAVALAGGAAAAGIAANASEVGLTAVFGPSKEDLEAELAEKIDAYLADSGTEIEASVAIERGEMHLDYNADQTHITASIVKAEILAMMLQYYGSAEAITVDHRELLELMITQSDNDATTELYNFLGGTEALHAAHERYGLQNTTNDEDGRWGVTHTIAADQLIIAELDLFEGTFAADQVGLARELMGSVVEEQNWGISAAAKEGESIWLKNGWDTESQLGGLWVVNSIGVLGGDGDDPISLTVLTSNAQDDVEGIPVVEDIAKIAREVIDQL
ncbi:serine hydrolase [Glycomyces buryatensis]|uniref:Beta-lactamase n=1 Tax=Glycomyces buryatensis TaxID=2570927 RepID=A0A4S8QEU6_9ACTN|nr:serine hydrolase [Glycomyces buryatensis]THV43167.1 hypothetical protein FAB82_02755 [Glycomyces buryatensis]